MSPRSFELRHAKWSGLHPVPSITMGVWLLGFTSCGALPPPSMGVVCHLLTSAQSHHQLPSRFPSFRSPLLMDSKGPRHLYTRASLAIYRSPGRQISSDPLQWPLDHAASMSCALSPPACASYDVLGHQFAGLRPASFRPTLSGRPLPFANSYHLIA